MDLPAQRLSVRDERGAKGRLARSRGTSDEDCVTHGRWEGVCESREA